jgi:hypothetical protein
MKAASRSDRCVPVALEVVREDGQIIERRPSGLRAMSGSANL